MFWICYLLLFTVIVGLKSDGKHQTTCKLVIFFVDFIQNMENIIISRKRPNAKPDLNAAIQFWSNLSNLKQQKMVSEISILYKNKRVNKIVSLFFSCSQTSKTKTKLLVVETLK